MSFLDIFKPLLGPIIEPILKLIPDPNARAKAKEDMERSLIEAGNTAMLAQIDVNKEEAKSASVFVAGWRPFIGWVCGVGIGWTFIIAPMVQWGAVLGHVEIGTLPELKTDGLMALVTAMLGLAGYRAFETVRGVARKSL